MDTEKKIIETKEAPSAVGPYSQGVEFESLIFTSGQLPIDPKTGAMPEAVAEQTKVSLDNVKAILEEAGSDLSKVLKTTVFMTNLEDFSQMNEVYAKYFEGRSLPTRSCFQVSKLPKGAQIEVEVIAFKK